MTILVTGASGFIGTAVLRQLLASGERVLAVVRRPIELAALAGSAATGSLHVTRKSINQETEWSDALVGVDRIAHLAARTHVLREADAESLAAYRRINVEGTRRLAQEAARAGVKRFVFLSSTKVNGESTLEQPFTESDPPHPEDAYGISKWEAEQALGRIGAETGMEIVVLRPPLVYGPGVKGNMLQLLRAVARGWPLPLASIRNRRSLVFVGNLVDAITAAIESPAAAGHTYLVSDGEDLSTPELVRVLAAALGASAALVPFPPPLLRLGGALLGRSAAVARLTGSLQIDSSRIRHELGWTPRYSLSDGMKLMAQWYHARSGLRPSY